jgi:hypothetical protein
MAALSNSGVIQSRNVHYFIKRYLVIITESVFFFFYYSMLHYSNVILHANESVNSEKKKPSLMLAVVFKDDHIPRLLGDTLQVLALTDELF